MSRPYTRVTSFPFTCEHPRANGKQLLISICQLINPFIQPLRSTAAVMKTSHFYTGQMNRTY